MTRALALVPLVLVGVLAWNALLDHGPRTVHDRPHAGTPQFRHQRSPDRFEATDVDRCRRFGARGSRVLDRVCRRQPSLAPGPIGWAAYRRFMW
jgi:hypothetical protein